MAKYRVEISATAERQLRRLPHDDQVRVVRAALALGSEPRPPGSRKLQGYDDVFRIRVGTYRVLYSVEGRHLLVIILKVGHRKDVCR
jgi:mRNA interferase RelE/StbE